MTSTPFGEARGLQEALGEALAQLAEERGLEAAQVCELAEISPAQWARIVEGNGGMAAIDAAARALGTLSVLAGGALRANMTPGERRVVAWAHNLAAGGRGPAGRLIG